MEKRGIIRPDITPTEKNEQDVKTAEDASTTELIAALDDDFRLRAAETVVKTKKM